MSIDYAMVTRCWRRNKSNLTRARNQHDLYKVLDVCEQAFADFREYGYPDDWMLFQRAAEDACIEIGRWSYTSLEQHRVNVARVEALN